MAKQKLNENIEYMFDLEKLKELMDEYGDSIASLAEYVGTSRQNLSQVFNGKHGFTYAQIVMIGKRYEMDPETFFDTFVTPFMNTLN